MSESDVYRQKALQLCQKANAQATFELRVEYESLAFVYMCLAEETDRDHLEWEPCIAANELGALTAPH